MIINFKTILSVQFIEAKPQCTYDNYINDSSFYTRQMANVARHHTQLAMGAVSIHIFLVHRHCGSSPPQACLHLCHLRSTSASVASSRHAAPAFFARCIGQCPRLASVIASSMLEFSGTSLDSTELKTTRFNKTYKNFTQTFSDRCMI